MILINSNDVNKLNWLVVLNSFVNGWELLRVKVVVFLNCWPRMPVKLNELPTNVLPVNHVYKPLVQL